MKLLSPTKKKLPEQTLRPLMEAVYSADVELRTFQNEHGKIFSKYEELVQAREVAENELRTASKKLGDGFEDERVSCEYVMPQSTTYDAAKLRTLVSAKILSALSVIVPREDVDLVALKALIRAKKVKKSVLDAITVKTPTGAPRVTITIKDED